MQIGGELGERYGLAFNREPERHVPLKGGHSPKLIIQYLADARETQFPACERVLHEARKVGLEYLADGFPDHLQGEGIAPEQTHERGPILCVARELLVLEQQSRRVDLQALKLEAFDGGAFVSQETELRGRLAARQHQAAAMPTLGERAQK